MAQIQEKVKNGKIVSFKIKVFLGRDNDGKQIFRCKTWKPPAGMTASKSRKEAERVAVLWKMELTSPHAPEPKPEPKRERKKKEPVADVQEAEPKVHRITFDEFVEDVWIPLCVRDGSHRPATIAMYTNILKVILPQFEDVPLQEITGIRISQYLRWLRNEYRKPDGKPLAEKSIKHHYNILGLIFSYAEKQDMIEKNPMKKVDPPKVSKKSVDALSDDEAVRFFNALLACDLEFRCMLQVFITTGLRRGECIGLQWQDIDFQKATLTVNRSVTYTPECGIVVAPPKTAHSIRTIPAVGSTLGLLKQLQKQQEREHPAILLNCAYVFPRPGDPFEARDPSAITRHMKRFIRSAGLPDVSPHDLRHTCASLLLSTAIASISTPAGSFNSAPRYWICSMSSEIAGGSNCTNCGPAASAI